MRLPFRQSDEETVKRDRATLKAWERGIISTRTAISELSSHNRWKDDIFTGVSENELVRAFNGLGYRQGEDDDGSSS